MNHPAPLYTERISKMKVLIVCLIIAGLFSCFSFPTVIRTYARKNADNIFNGKRTATEKQIHRYISALVWTNKYVTHDPYLDNQRIIQLRDMLKEMQNPHG